MEKRLSQAHDVNMTDLASREIMKLNTPELNKELCRWLSFPNMGQGPECEEVKQ